MEEVSADDVLLIKEATDKGYSECEIGGVADLSYPDSKTRRGRVKGKGNICPTLVTEAIPSVLERFMYRIGEYIYLVRIRKLTPRECWRLQAFKDEDYEAAEKVNSMTQLYKQCGNSICVSCLEEIFKMFF